MILLQFSLSQICFTGRAQHFLFLLSCIINYNSLEKPEHFMTKKKKIPWSEPPFFNRAIKLNATLANKREDGAEFLRNDVRSSKVIKRFHSHPVNHIQFPPPVTIKTAWNSMWDINGCLWSVRPAMSTAPTRIFKPLYISAEPRKTRCTGGLKNSYHLIF